MPNIFAPLGFAMGRMNKDPLMGVNAVTQTLGGYEGGRGSSDPYGGQGAAGGGLGSDPVSRSLMLQSLAEGQPATEAQRTPQEGLFKYGLSKLGILSPMVHASADQYHLEQLALKGQEQQRLKESGDIFKTAIEISKTSPEAAKAYFENYAGQQMDPAIWAGIKTKSDLEQQKILIDQQKADTAQTRVEDQDKEAVLRYQGLMGHLGLQEAHMFEQDKKADARDTREEARDARLERTEEDRVKEAKASRYTQMLVSPNSSDDDKARARRGLHDLGLYPDVPMPNPSDALAAGGGASGGWGDLMGPPHVPAAAPTPVVTSWSKKK